jgi:hypothetical protein
MGGWGPLGVANGTAESIDPGPGPGAPFRALALKRRVQEALAEIRTLSGLLPICAWCKKIRAEDGRWRQIEAYVKDHTQADFSHGIWPECSAQTRSPVPPGST